MAPSVFHRDRTHPRSLRSLAPHGENMRPQARAKPERCDVLMPMQCHLFATSPMLMTDTMNDK